MTGRDEPAVADELQFNRRGWAPSKNPDVPDMPLLALS